MVLENKTPYESLSSHFSVAELRGMNRASVILRGMLRREGGRFALSALPRQQIGIYVLGEESSIAGMEMDNIWSLLDGDAPNGTTMESLRKIPAKGFVALPASRVGAQLAMESGAGGPLICAHFEKHSIDFIIQEIEADFQCGVIQGFILAAFLETRRDCAFLAGGQEWNAEIRAKLIQSLNRCLV